MSTSAFSFETYLLADAVVEQLAVNLAIEYKTSDVATWPREKMQAHVNDRAALIRTRELLIQAAENTRPQTSPQG